MIHIKNILLILFVVVVAVSCDKEKKSAKKSNQIPEKEWVKAPRFSADSAYTFIQKQVDFGPRVPNTAAHKACGDFIVNKLSGYGAQVVAQEFEANTYDGTKFYLRNIIASFNPERSKRVLLAAHWDTRPIADKDTFDIDKPIDGANDGGSGVGILLEIARIVSQNPDMKVGIDMIFFDGEDNGMPSNYAGNIIAEYKDGSKSSWCLGSQYWSINKHTPNYTAYYGILLDMVGAKGSKFYKEGLSTKYAPSIVNKVWGIASESGYGQFFVDKPRGQITDDHAFVNAWAKIPMIDIIEYTPGSGFGAYHHTHSDNMKIIDKILLNAVGQTVLNVVYNE